MALTLPEWLVGAIGFLGYDFPASDEDVLHRWADHLKSLDHTMVAAHDELLTAVRHVHEHNHGPATDAFGTYVSGPDGEAEALVRFSEGCEIASKGCDICAYAVIVLKGVILFQLALIAPAIVAGPVSFVVKKAVEWAINQAISVAVSALIS
jgi:hypothetical protein